MTKPGIHVCRADYGRNDHAADCWPHTARHIEPDRIRHDRRGDQIPRHLLADGRLPSRRERGSTAANQKREAQ